MASRPHKYITVLTLIFALVLVSGTVIFLDSLRKNSTPEDLLSEQISGVIISGMFDTSSTKTDAEWKKVLSPTQYHILREAGTEIPFTGRLMDEKRKGTYYSVGCNKPLFRSEQKYESNTGWPSFWAPISEEVVVLRKETGLGDNRIEVLDTCGGHLGHVFDDGPEPTGKRYCINSIALYFVLDNEY